MIIIIAEDQLFLLTQCSAERILLMTTKTTSFQFFVCSHHCFAFILPLISNFKMQISNQNITWYSLPVCRQKTMRIVCNTRFGAQPRKRQWESKIVYRIVCAPTVVVACTRFHTQSYACAGFGSNFNVTRISVEIDAVIIQLDPCAIRYWQRWIDAILHIIVFFNLHLLMLLPSAEWSTFYILLLFRAVWAYWLTHPPSNDL